MRKLKVRGLTALARIPELVLGRADLKLGAICFHLLCWLPEHFLGWAFLEESREEELEKGYSRPEMMLVWHYQVNIKVPSGVLEGRDPQQAATQLLLGIPSERELSPLNKAFS